MRLPLTIFLLLIGLCAVASPIADRLKALKVKKPAPLQSPKAASVQAVKPMLIVVPLTMRTNTVVFRYPANGSNYVWSMQYSTDLKHWTDIPGDYFGWPPATTNKPVRFETNASSPRCLFYRMKGRT